MDKFFPTFAYQLAHFLPSTQQLIHVALRDRAILTKRRRDQFANLIVRPVQSITQPASPMIIVIDGLDEYDEVGGAFPLKDLIQLLLRDLPGIPFRFLFTSRPEARIEAIFSIPGISSSTRRIALQDFPDGEVISNYLKSGLLEVRAKRHLPLHWPSEEVIRSLTDKSEGIWIYASTLVKFVDDEYDEPQRKLELALKAHKGLDSLFEQVLDDAKTYRHFDLVLGAIVFVRRNPTILVLSQLLQLNSVNDIQLALRGCLSVLVVPDRDEDYIRPYHASLIDFLSDPTRRRDRFIDPVKCNKTIVDSCMQLITTDSGTSNRAFRYACWHWPRHFHMMLFHAKADRDSELHLCNVVENFLNHFFSDVQYLGCWLQW